MKQSKHLIETKIILNQNKLVTGNFYQIKIIPNIKLLILKELAK